MSDDLRGPRDGPLDEFHAEIDALAGRIMKALHREIDRMENDPPDQAKVDRLVALSKYGVLVMKIRFIARGLENRLDQLEDPEDED